MNQRRLALLPALIGPFVFGLTGLAPLAAAQESQDNQPHIQPRNNPPAPSSQKSRPQPNPGPEAGQPGESSSADSQADFSGASRARPSPTSGERDEKSFRPWDPHRADKDVEVGNYYLKLKNYRAALERFNDALLYKPGDAEATFGLAVTQEKMDLTAKARQNYSKYLEILSEGPHAKECHEAIKRIDARAGAASAPDDAAGQVARDIEAGETFLSRNNYDAARERFEDALRLAPDNALACFRLAQSLRGLQRPEPARSYYQKYLELDPHGPFAADAKKAIADINFMVGK